jgi:GntR family transcriptional regulator
MSPYPTEGGEADVLGADTPMHLQIYRRLKAEILDGLWVGRGDFPGERELAERFGVSVITSRSSLERLAREGLVDRGRGRRTRSTYDPPDDAPAAQIDIFPPADGRSPLRFKLLSSWVGIAPAAACRAFGKPAGSHLWQVTRIVSAGGKIQGVTHGVQLAEVGVNHSRRDLSTKPMVSILRSAGVEVAAIRREIQATNPPPLVARHLGLSLDSAVLMVVLTCEDDEHRTVEWMRSFGHPDCPLPREVQDLTTGWWRKIDDLPARQHPNS